MTEIITFKQLPAGTRMAIEAGATRILCPRCDGGRSHEASLSVRHTEAGLLKLSCWRSTCNWYALTSVAGENVTIVRKDIKQATYYREPVRLLTALTHHLCAYYGLRRTAMATHGWRESEDGRTLVMPVVSPYDGIRGYVTRTFDEPKRCMTYKATAMPWLDWWTRAQPDSAPVVVVEDCLSACRIYGLDYNACALLGTSMTVEHAKEIVKVAGDRQLILALDRDAFSTAVKLRKRFAHIFPSNIRVLCLDEDIKNIHSDDDVRSLIDG